MTDDQTVDDSEGGGKSGADGTADEEPVVDARLTLTRRQIAGGAAILAGLGAGGGAVLFGGTRPVLATAGAWSAADVEVEDEERVEGVLVGDDGSLELEWENFEADRTYGLDFELEARLATEGESPGSDDYEPIATAAYDRGHQAAFDTTGNGVGQKIFDFLVGESAAGDAGFVADSVVETGPSEDVNVDLVEAHTAVTAADFNPPDGADTAEETTVELQLTLTVRETPGDPDAATVDVDGTVRSASFTVTNPVEGEPGTPGDGGTATPTAEDGSLSTGGMAGVDVVVATDSEPADIPYNGGTFTVGSTETRETFHPLRVDDPTDRHRLRLLYDAGGVRLGDAPDDWGGYWIADWEINDSYDAVTYTLRDDLEWGGNYGALTADDYVFTLEEIVLPTGADDWYDSPRTERYLHGPDAEPVTVQKVDDLTFEVQLPEPRPNYWHTDPLHDEFVLPKGLLEQYVPDHDAEAIDNDTDVLDGTLTTGNVGAYELEDSSPALVLSRNDDYYMQNHDDWPDPAYDFSTAPHVDELRFEVFEGATAAIEALQAGDVQQFDGIDPRKVPNVATGEDVQLYEDPFASGTQWVALNHRINGWDPIRESAGVRQALAEAYDNGSVVDTVYDGHASPTATFLPEWGSYYPDEGERYESTGDLDAAATLLEDSTGSDYGYDSSGNFTSPDGSPVELTVVYTSGNTALELAAQQLQSRLDQLGFDASLTSGDANTVMQNYLFNDASNVDGVDEADWVSSSFNGGPWNQAASAEDWDVLFFDQRTAFDQQVASVEPYMPADALRQTLTERGEFNFGGFRPNGYDLAGMLRDATTAATPEAASETLTDALGELSTDQAMLWSHTPIAYAGYTDSAVGLVGTRTTDGVETRSYWDHANPRMVGYDQPPE